jgi:peptidoglycan/LPS O-acetylase OafA/YrhL
MRGIAAILVMCYHYYLQSAQNPLPNAFIAVDFFFILSGFVIMHAYGGRLANGMPLPRYLAHRVIRLYPMMALSLLIGAPVFLLYTKMGHTDFSMRDIVASVASNLCFLPYLNDKTIFGTPDKTVGLLFPVNGPLWSIFFELAASGAFIILYRFGQATLRRVCLAALALMVGGGMLTAFSTYNHSLASGFGWGTQNLLGGFPRVLYGFTCGMLLYQARQQLGRAYFSGRFFSSNAGSLILYPALAAMLIFPGNFHGLYYLLAIAMLAPVLVMWGGAVTPSNRLLLQASRFLGWISFPLYCLHMPVFNATIVLDEKFGLQMRTGVSPQIFAIGATFGLAIVLGYGVDAPVRQWLRARLDQKHQPERLVYRHASAPEAAMGFSEER